jgi:hypothetical protein
MSESRDKRNKLIGDWYVNLRKKGKTHDEAIDLILNSEENKLMCLKRDAIRLIATYKNYGKSKVQRCGVS